MTARDRRATKVLIRDLKSNDAISELTRMLHAAYSRLGDLGYNYTAVDQSEDVTRERVAQADCLVAVDFDNIVGTITVRKPGRCTGCPCYDRQGVATVGQFGVLPSYQERGIGSLLIGEAERRARSVGATELALDTSEGADHLVVRYERLGFVFVEYVQWSGKTYRSVIMSKPLRQSSTST